MIRRKAMKINDLETPALILDKRIFEANMEKMTAGGNADEAETTL